jgi:hypothetical protein
MVLTNEIRILCMYLKVIILIVFLPFPKTFQSMAKARKLVKRDARWNFVFRDWNYETFSATTTLDAQVSISPTFYARLFRTKVLRKAFLC